MVSAIMAKKRPVAKTDDEMLTDEFQTMLLDQAMPEDDYREIEGEGAEREKMKRRGMIEAAIKKSRSA